MAAFRVLNEGALLRAALSSDLQKMRAAKNVEANYADAPTDTSHVYDAG